MPRRKPAIRQALATMAVAVVLAFGSLLFYRMHGHNTAATTNTNKRCVRGRGTVGDWKRVFGVCCVRSSFRQPVRFLLVAVGRIVGA